MRRLLLLAAALLLAAPATASADDLTDALSAMLKAKGGPPGAFAIVQRGTNVENYSIGTIDVKRSRSWRADDPMRLASVSKAFTGAASLALVQQGRLSLDDTVASRTTGLPAAWGPVTLRQLLQHTSGIPSYTKNAGLIRGLQTNPGKPYALQALAEVAASDPVEFAPGTGYEYSNTDNLIVALMVEQATGQPWKAALQSLVLDPLRLGDTYEPTSLAFPRNGVRGYFMDPPKRPENVTAVVNPTAIGPSGDLISTAGDLNRFIRGYNDGSLFSGAVRDAQLQVRPGSSEPQGPGSNDAGLAIFRYTTRCGVVYGHTGNFPGYTQFTAATPEGTNSVTLSANTQLDKVAPGRFAAKVFKKFRAAADTAVCTVLGR